MKIVTTKTVEYIDVKDVDQNKNIFFGKDGKLVGMLIRNNDFWWIRTSPTNVMGGHFSTIGKVIEYGQSLGYTFYVDVDV